MRTIFCAIGVFLLTVGAAQADLVTVTLNTPANGQVACSGRHCRHDKRYGCLRSDV